VWQAVEATDDQFEATVGFRPAPGQVLNGLGEDRGAIHFMSFLADFTEANSPLRPEFRQAYQQRAAGGGKDGPDPHCLPIGIPGIYTWPAPYKILGMGDVMVFLSEADGRFRQVYLDGRKLPVEPTPAWFGYSVGKWEGDTLVVESAGFNDDSWLDVTGHVHSDRLKVTERLRRRDFGHMDVEITIDDPVIYSRPFTVKVPQRLLPDTDLFEYVCNENEKDLVHLNAQPR
jgi:hypothetical protein